MQTSITPEFKNTPQGQEADAILRKCVHCGFCNATCPTYQLLGDELDGPRGRIYLMKSMLEGQGISRATQVHLDRCLTCRACETTCPSGVQYGNLLEIGRQRVEQEISRPLLERIKRRLLRTLVPYPQRLRLSLKFIQWLRSYFPASLQQRIPAPVPTLPWPERQHVRRMLILSGCVQSILATNINAATAQVLDKLGITAIPAGGCCGALSQHLGAAEEAYAFMRRNIDNWLKLIEQTGAEAIISTASGCGVSVKEYGHVLRHDPIYAERAARINAMTKDIVEILRQEDLNKLTIDTHSLPRIAFQSPCTLQHGQRLNGMVEALLLRLGFTLTIVADAHLCCGSAGTYSLLQSQLAKQLRQNKLENLQAGQPEVIATANIGCYHWLQQATQTPVKHWIEVLAALNINVNT